MSATGKSHHERFQTNFHHAHRKNADEHPAIVANDDATPSGAVNSAKDSAATIHESRIRAAATPAAIGTAAGLPGDSTSGNPIYSMAKSLVMKDSALDPPETGQAHSARARSAGS
jgi:hypothetical protein